MPNFDALRPAISGPLSYLCKPAPPVELLGCWPLTSDYSDKSRYGNTASGGGSAYINATTYIAEPFSPCWGYANSTPPVTSLVLPCKLNLEQPFSIDWVGYYFGLSGFRLICGNLNLSFSNDWGQNPNYPVGINWNGSNLLSFGPTKQAQTHFALRYTGSILYYYENGALKKNATVALSGTINQVSTDSDNNQYEGSHVSNIRVVQKALGSNSYYPVPSSPYTGFEVI